MPGFPPEPPPSDHHGDAVSTSEGSDVAPVEEVTDMELSLDLFLSTSSPTQLDADEVDGSWSQDGDLQGCGQLERRWLLWHEFMKEHAHLDTWLRLAEQAVSSSNPAHVTYVSAKEEQRKFERLRCEAGSRLVQLDSLTRRNRMLTRLFQGAMKARLLASARECGQRWDDVNGKLETITGRLKVFEDDWILSQATDSGCPSESLLEDEGALDKANLDVPAVSEHADDPPSPVRLPPPSPSSPTHEHLGLEWDPSVDIGRSVSRDDADSSYFSASTGQIAVVIRWIKLQEDDAVKACSDDRCHAHFDVRTCARPSLLAALILSTFHVSGAVNWKFSAQFLMHLLYRPHSGRSLSSHNETSVNAASFGNTYETTLMRLSGWFDHTHPAVFSPVETKGGGTRLNGDQWATSTPDREDSEPISFDGGRVRAWLGVQSPAPLERRTSCSKAVQTDGQVKLHLEGSYMDTSNSQRRHDNTQQPFPAPSPAPSHDVKPLSDWMKHQYRSNLQDEEEQSCWEEAECLLSEQRVTSSSRTPSSLLSPALLYLLLAAALVLLACLIWVALEPPCHRSGRMPRGFHLTLRYVNGPPPT
ncbi:Nesprin-2 [Larimichthys crocea]|uniref:Uncharacterized protein n=1 Tax=Larimichthys crocea TaxID=215358 RepID=A0ACD3QIG3_LARCR|nr:Nesprin-2 [Larimichthys crocea]